MAFYRSKLVNILSGSQLIISFSKSIFCFFTWCLSTTSKTNCNKCG